MTWLLNGKEFESVIHLDPEARYKYFVKKVADWGELWSLWNDGWALMGGSQQEVVPVWPHPLFAEAFATAGWQDYKPRRIDLQDWLNKWTPGMERDRRTVGVFPAQRSQTTIATPLKLKTDLQDELAKYE